MTFLHQIPWSPGNEDPATRTPATAEQFNAAALWKRATIAEMENIPTENLVQYANDCPVYCAVPGAGLYRYDPDGTAAVDGYTVVDANGPGQWVLDMPAPSYYDGFIENALARNDLADIKLRLDAIEGAFPKIIQYKQATNGISINANSHGNIPIILNIPGQTIYPSDSVIVTPPIQYQGPGQPILGLPCIRSKNVMIINFYNPSGSTANNVGGGDWVFTFLKGTV